MTSDYVALIIGYKNAELMTRVLSSLAAQTVLPRAVMVVDNGGTFTEADRATWPLSSLITLVSRPENPGYGAAVNSARPALGNSALLVLTHDASFEPNTAQKLIDALQAPHVGATAPILRYANAPERIFSAGGKLSQAGRASHLQKPISARPYRVDWVDGATVMYSAESLNAIDWLDEKYFLYFEDVDTGWRLARAGWQSVIVPEAQGHQQPGAHPPYLGMRNMALFARKAGISRVRHLWATLPRLARESFSRMRHGLKPEVMNSLRGLRDGYAGKSGTV